MPNPDAYHFPLPPGDDPSCHAVDGCPAGGYSFLRHHHNKRWPAKNPVRDAIQPDVGLRRDRSSLVANDDSLGPATGSVFAFHQTPVDAESGRSRFCLASEFTLATLIDPFTRPTRTPVDTANGGSGSSFPSGSTFAPRTTRLVAMPQLVAPLEDVRFRARRRASGSFRGGGFRS